MKVSELKACLERYPIISVIYDENWSAALEAPPEILFHLKANINTLPTHVQQAHSAGKWVFVHIDLADGIGKDRAGLHYLKNCGVDGIISTRSQMIRLAHDAGLLAVQRCFALDSQGVSSIDELLENSSPDLLEIMPGVIGKVIEHFSKAAIPVIAGGLIETKVEVTTALGCGAYAVSTGKQDLWYI